MKFKYNFRLEGHGGQISVSKINKKQFQYWYDRQEYLVDHLNTEEGFYSVDKTLRLIEKPTYWDKANILYEYGVEFSEDSLIIIENNSFFYRWNIFKNVLNFIKYIYFFSIIKIVITSN